MIRSGLGGALVALVVLAGCGGKDDGSSPATGATKGYVAIDTDKLCDLAVNQCKGSDPTFTVEKCKDEYKLVRVAPSCKATLDSATCTTTEDEFFKACFPACDPAKTAAACDGSNISECSDDGKLIILDCTGVCETFGRKFSGICGKSTDGTDKCGCQ